MRQRKEYDVVVADRDILGTQLVRRNDELSLLYEKIKIQQVRLQMTPLSFSLPHERPPCFARSLANLQIDTAKD